ncbi:MAG: glycoside hydrolase family 15 protein [Chloroflexi bacterium]|nr:glycoside hydrolase family 15 protein [Chloroflexota bacterium]
MPRHIVLGNGRMAVALDNKMRVKDFFYPRVGVENHTSSHDFKIGVWTDGVFSWVGDGWHISMGYLPDTLVSRCVAENGPLGITLEVNDAVHNFLDVYLRKLIVHNLGDSRREVRVFLSQDFHIYGVDEGDTAMYEPVLDCIIHYKRKRYFLINGTTDQNGGIDQFSTGRKETPVFEGTWKDAEDGALEGNPIAQGAVDSVVSFKLEVEPKATRTTYYWVACGRSSEDVKALNSQVKGVGAEQLFLETENYWSAWVSKQDVDLTALPRDIARIFKKALLIMRTHVDNGGGIIASCDSDALQFNRDTYAYAWPRDGAIAAMAFDMAGFTEVSRLFFEFCDRVITDGGYFLHKYSSDGCPGSSWHPWVDARGQPQLPIQEDETALVLFALWRHYQKHRDLEFIGMVYPKLIVKATDFLLSYRDERTGLPKPSYDPWEERFGVFTSTVATTCAALAAGARFARVFYDSKRQELLDEAAMQMKQAMSEHLYDRSLGRFIKAIYPDGSRDLSLDSSISSIFTRGPFNAGDEEVAKTMKALAEGLWVRTAIGGMARYENDSYYRLSKRVPGNPWFVCTLWLARWHFARADCIEELKEGLDLLSWVVRYASPSGVLGEQLDPHTGAPISVSPLVWSHAEFVIAVCEYLARYQEFSPG